MTKRADRETKHWEYRFFNFAPGMLMSGLERIGVDGWEAFYIEREMDCIRVFGKREVT